MRKNKGIKLLSVALFGTLALGVAACTKEKTADPIALSGWENGAASASYGSTYTVETIATDTNGVNYPIGETAVKNSDGESVALEYGKFVVTDKEGYTIDYALTVNGQSFAKTVTLAVTAAKPMLVLSETQATVFVGYAYALPTCSITDYVDGEIAEYTIELYKETAAGDEKQEVALTAGGTFTPTATGEYYLLYSAKNSGDAVGTARVELSSYTVAEYWGDTTNEILTIGQISSAQIVASGSTASYLKADEEELSDFVARGYEGNASKFTWIGGTRTYTTTVPYTDAEIGFLSDLFGYTHVSMWMSYDFDEGKYFCSTGNSFHTKSGGTWSSLKLSGTKRWKKYSVDIETFKTLTNSENSLTLLKLCCDSGTEGAIVANAAAVYFGDIFLEKLEADDNVLTVKEETAGNVTRGAVAGEFTYSDTLAGFTANGYTGDAVKHTWTEGGQTYYVSTEYTLETMQALGYTHVSMWLAYDYTGTGELYSTGAPTLHLSSGGAWASLTAAGVKTWQKYTVTLEQFAALTAEGKAKLLKICCDTGSSDVSGVTLYFGDIVFETITA